MKNFLRFFALFVCVIGIYSADAPATDSTTKEPTTSTSESTTMAPTAAPTETTSVTSTSTESTSTSTTLKPTESTPTAEPTTTPTLAPTTAEPSSTTVAPTTAPPPPSTTPMPAPDAGSWDVVENNVTCIRAKMAVRISITLNNETTTHNLSPNATSDQSRCEYQVNVTTEQSLVLEDENYVLTFVFGKNAARYYIQNITVAWSKEEEDVRHINGEYFPVLNRRSYRCENPSDIKLENVTLEFTAMQIQAFGLKDDTGFLKEVECVADDKMDDMIPIAVACVLVAMVVIILIGYLIGRRQTRQRGYQSV